MNETPSIFGAQVGQGVPASPHLLPCPFCGNAPEMSCGMNEWWVSCACRVSGPSGETAQNAAHGWNRRTAAELRLNHAIDEAAIARLDGDAAPNLGKPALVSTIRWMRVADGLPLYGVTVAVWIELLGSVVRAYRDARAEDGGWCVAGTDGPALRAELVTAWTDIPLGALPPPDGGAA